MEHVYTIDWWRPATITGTRMGIEDFLFGFWVGGISSVIYEEIFKKKVYTRKPKKGRPLLFGLLFSFGLAFLFFGSFYLLKLSSFESSIVAFAPLTLLIWTIRRDLILDSLATGFFMVVAGLFWFWIPEYFTPGWVSNHWLFENLSGVVILNAPLEDLIWVFLAGAYIGPLYEFWKGSRLVSYK